MPSAFHSGVQELACWQYDKMIAGYTRRGSPGHQPFLPSYREYGGGFYHHIKSCIVVMPNYQRQGHRMAGAPGLAAALPEDRYDRKLIKVLPPVTVSLSDSP